MSDAADPADPANGPSYHTGKPCVERGCEEPAGTAWSPHWCQRHNAERMDRISASFNEIEAEMTADSQANLPEHPTCGLCHARHPRLSRNESCPPARSTGVEQAEHPTDTRTPDPREARRRLLAARPSPDTGLATPLQREVSPEPICSRCEKPITTLGGLYRCAQCHALFDLLCIREHFGWSVNENPHPPRLADSTAPEPGLTEERAFADALVAWYDTTHGNEFGHDHHCPVRDDRRETFTAAPDDRCTCGWSTVLRADKVRADAAARLHSPGAET